jgi:hypothetical protein
MAMDLPQRLKCDILNGCEFSKKNCGELEVEAKFALETDEALALFDHLSVGQVITETCTMDYFFRNEIRMTTYDDGSIIAMIDKVRNSSMQISGCSKVCVSTEMGLTLGDVLRRFGYTEDTLGHVIGTDTNIAYFLQFERPKFVRTKRRRSVSLRRPSSQSPIWRLDQTVVNTEWGSTTPVEKVETELECIFDGDWTNSTIEYIVQSLMMKIDYIENKISRRCTRPVDVPISGAVTR